MASPMHVKALGKWKNVSIDPKRVSSTMMTGFLCMQELTDYEIIQGSPTNKSKKARKVNSLLSLVHYF